MHHLKQFSANDDYSGTWCNSNAVTSSVLEAVSLVTPVLEKFFIRTVADALPAHTENELRQRCQEFIREESNHSCIHQKFNNSLFNYLGSMPPGLSMVEAMLDSARRHLSITNQLLLAAALEHLAAVLSKVYMQQEGKLHIDSDFARELFAFHAREEIAHCSVVFDLWRSQGDTGRTRRALTIMAILLMGAIYASRAVPWILYRKNSKHAWRTVKALAGFVRGSFACFKDYSPLAEMLSFVRHSYHPDKLFGESLTTDAR